MNRDIAFIRDNFFIICSHNLDSIPSRMYGDAVIDNSYFNGVPAPGGLLPGDIYGHYINIVNGHDQLLIQQDYYGLGHIFIYEKAGFFALSNSFLYLLSFLCQRTSLTFNYKFATTSLWTGTSLIYNETIINEIKLLPHFCMLHIDKRNGNLKKLLVPQKKYFIPLCSRQGLDILDAWHDKWHAILKAFESAGKDLVVTISGGRDSRAALGTLVDSSQKDIDLAKICFFSHTHPSRIKDYQLAEKIGAILGFELNACPENNDSFHITTFLSLASSFLCKMTLHNQMEFPLQGMAHPKFYLGGTGGEYLRHYWNEEPKQFIEQFLCGPPRMQAIIADVLARSMGEAASEYKSPYGPVQGIYECCRGRNHFGLYFWENSLINKISLAPLLDPMLEKLNPCAASDGDRNILFAIIYDRYLRHVADLPFDDDTRFSPDTRELAREINARYPRHVNQAHDVCHINYAPRLLPAQAVVAPEPRQRIHELFCTDIFMDVMGKMYGNDIYLAGRRQLASSEMHVAPLAQAMISVFIAFFAISPGLRRKFGQSWLDEIVNLASGAI